MHEHEHTHADGHSHSHPHEHNHTHEHTHTHEHGIAKEVALLSYMLEHNKQHAGELAQMGSKLSETGFAESAQLISDAVRDFDCANDKLSKALGLIDNE